MSHSPDIRFPVFIVLDDGSLFRGQREQDLRWFEEVDVNSREFGPCWDRDGYPLEITWQGRAVLVPLAEAAEPAAVLNALQKWAEAARVEVARDSSDPETLWSDIDSALRARTLPGRIGRMLRLWKRPGSSAPPKLSGTEVEEWVARKLSDLRARSYDELRKLGEWQAESPPDPRFGSQGVYRELMPDGRLQIVVQASTKPVGPFCRVWARGFWITPGGEKTDLTEAETWYYT